MQVVSLEKCEMKETTAMANRSRKRVLAAMLEGSDNAGACYTSTRKRAQQQGDSTSRYGWGMVSRVVIGSYFSEELSVALREKKEM